MDEGNHKDDMNALKKSGEEQTTEQNNKSAAEASLNEYSSCQFRFDINAPNEQNPSSSGYEILMQLNARNGQKHVVELDAKMLAFLHEQLEKVEQAFPRCYVYKTGASDNKT